MPTLNRFLTVVLRALLLVIKRHRLALDDVPPGEETEPRQVGVQAIDPHVEDGEIGVARVVDEVGHVAVEGGVHGVGVALGASVEVEVEEVGAALGV